jgi:hypothetical protein
MRITQLDKYRTWKDVYTAALLEGQPGRTVELLNAAEKAIQDRLRELHESGPRSPREMLELDDAQRVLLLLRNHGEDEIVQA